MKLHDHFCKLKKNEISADFFLLYLRNIVEERIMKMAVDKLPTAPFFPAYVNLESNEQHRAQLSSVQGSSTSMVPISSTDRDICSHICRYLQELLSCFGY